MSFDGRDEEKNESGVFVAVEDDTDGVLEVIQHGFWMCTK